MNQAILVEVQFFLISILSGVILLVVYDCLRIFRRLINHDSFFIALEDLIFWVAASLFIFAMMYKENNGVIRGFSILGMAVGMVLYHYILSGFLVDIITKLLRLLISPFTYIIKKMKSFIKFIDTKAKKAIKFITRRLKKQTKSVRIALNTRKQVIHVKQEKRFKDKMLKKQKEDEKKQNKKMTEKKMTEKKKAEKKKADRKKGI